MFYKLCAAVVLIYCSIIEADIHAQNSFTSKSISLTTLIGETVEFTCSEYNMELLNTSTRLTWFKNEELLRNIIKNNPNKTFLDASGDTLTIHNVTNEDAGTFKCVTSNQSHSDISIYTLTVNGLPKPKTYDVYTSNKSESIGSQAYILCSSYMNDDGDNDNSRNYTYYKNGKQLFFGKSNERIRIDENLDLKINSVTQEDGGTYECVTSNKFRIDHAVTYLYIVDNKIQKYFHNIVHATKHLSDKIDWACDGSTWSKNNKTIIPFNENTHIEFYGSFSKLDIKNLTFKDSGNYTCNSSNENHIYYLHISLNVIDPPDKLSFKMFDSNISLIIGETFQLKCHMFQSTGKYKTWYSWKKDGGQILLNRSTKNIYFKKNQFILELRNVTSNEIGTYECTAESYYHKVYSTYTLTIPDNITKSIAQVNSTFDYPVRLTCILFFILIASVTIYCICWLRRKKTTSAESKANKFRSLYEHREKWKADLNIEVHTYESPNDNIYDKIISPLSRPTMSGDNSVMRIGNSIEEHIYDLPYDNKSMTGETSGLRLESSIEERNIYVLPYDNISEMINSPLNRSTVSGNPENLKQLKNNDGIEMDQIFHNQKLFNQGKNELKKFMVTMKNNFE